jgi:hypothetical protein
MKYLLMGDDTKTLFIEDDKQLHSIYFNKHQNRWLSGGMRLWDARVGFDPSEPEDSPYRYGNGSCMPDIIEISKEEAEEFIEVRIDESEINHLLIELNR